MTAPVPPAPRVRRQTGVARLVIVGVVIAAALGFLIYRGLDTATMYFRTADEAIAQRATLGDSRFRIEGTVVPGSIKEDGALTLFSIVSKNVTVDVRNTGQPLGVFQDNIPVVLEGHFAEGSNLFESDRIMVKHSSEYEQQHPERVSGDANR